MDRGQRKTCQSWRRAGTQVYDAWSYAIRLQVLPSQPIRATPLFPEHRHTLQGNAPVLAGVEHQARLVKLQADWQAGAQDEPNENEVGQTIEKRRIWTKVEKTSRERRRALAQRSS